MAAARAGGATALTGKQADRLTRKTQRAAEAAGVKMPRGFQRDPDLEEGGRGE